MIIGKPLETEFHRLLALLVLLAAASASPRHLKQKTPRALIGEVDIRRRAGGRRRCNGGSLFSAAASIEFKRRSSGGLTEFSTSLG